MTTVEVEGIVVVVIAVEHGDTVDFHAVAGEIVLHPATGIFQRHAADPHIRAADEAEEMRTGYPFVVPRELRKSAAAAVDSALAGDGHTRGAVGIDELYGWRVGAERHIIGLYGRIVGYVGAAEKRGAVFEMQRDIVAQEDASDFIGAGRDEHRATSGASAGVDGALHGLGGEACGVAHGTVGGDVVHGGAGAKAPQPREKSCGEDESMESHHRLSP